MFDENQDASSYLNKKVRIEMQQRAFVAAIIIT